MLNLTRKRHSLLQVLPEFERPKNEYIHRALINLFHPSTRWTWADSCDNVATLLKAFSQDVAERISVLFSDLSLDDHGNLLVELNLLAKLNSESNNELIHDTLNKIITNERTRLVGLSVAIENDVAVNLLTCPFHSLKIALLDRRWRYPYIKGFDCRNFLSCISTDQTVNLFVRDRTGYFFWVRQRLVPNSWLHDLWECLMTDVVLVDLEEINFSGYPFVVDRSEKAANPDVISHLVHVSSQFGQFAYKLLLAIAKPTDFDLDRAARQSADSLDEQVKLKVGEQLGPDPSLFSSLTNWKAYKSELYGARLEAIIPFRAILDQNPSAWIALLFHPDAWDELRGLVTDEALDFLRQTKWVQVQRYLPGHVLPFKLTGWGAEAGKLDIYKLCQAVVKAIQKHGPLCVVSDTILFHFILSEIGILKFSKEQAEKLLKQAISLSDLPSQWAVTIIGVCSQPHNIDEKFLLELWQQHPSAEEMFGNFMPRGHQVNINLIELLLKHDNVASVTLAAFLSPPQHDEHRAYSVSQLPADLFSRLISCLIRKVVDKELPEKERLRSLKALLFQPAHPEELRLWHNPQILQTAVNKNSGILGLICRKLREIVEVKTDSDHEILKKDLAVFVENRLHYPHQIALSAMESLLRLDEINISALQPEDWQAVK